MRPCQHLISLLLCLNLVLAVVVSKIDDDDQGPHLTRRQEFSFDPDVTDGGGSFDPEGNPMFPTDGTIPDGTDVNGGTDVGGDPNVEGGKDTPSETSYGSGSGKLLLTRHVARCSADTERYRYFCRYWYCGRRLFYQQ